MSDINAALETIHSLPEDHPLTLAARENIRTWLTQPRYARYADEVARHIAEEKWQKLDDVFYTVIPFGTGGRRGRMYPIGCNAINDRTIGESAAGLAAYVKETVGGGDLSCGIAYDTRHKSRHFAELCARIMVAAGFTVFFLDDIRSTPELSYLVRYKHCTCGIMVTASHNPPTDNAVKVYWSTGGQVLPPHDSGIIERVMSVEQIDDEVDFDAAVADGRIVFCKREVDAAFQREVAAQAPSGPREAKIIYSPLHGVGLTATTPVLEAAGFGDVEVFGPHAEPNADFPNVPDHVANPENPAVFDPMIERGRQIGADIALASDPDCDRLGVAAPVTTDASGAWKTFTGNQIAVLLADYVLEQKAQGGLSPDNFIVQTLVTTQMVHRIGDSYRVRTIDNLLVGFKWIAGAIDEFGPDKFLYGCEESHGYMVGSYVRDKDGAAAALLMSCLAAKLKAEGKSLHEKLDDLFWQHGYHAEDLINQKMEGSAGMEAMQQLMTAFRERPPESLGGMPVQRVRDYKNSRIVAGGQQQPLDGPVGDLVILDLAQEGNYVAVRPSGTEPKVKFYLFAYTPAEQLHDLETTKEETAALLASVAGDLKQFVDRVAK